MPARVFYRFRRLDCRTVRRLTPIGNAKDPPSGVLAALLLELMLQSNVAARPAPRNLAMTSARPATWLLIALAGAGCAPSAGRNQQSVVVYTALDAEFSEQLLDEFSVKTGIAALPKFDAESTKTVGLAQAIMAEAARPRCDVFWNNEILNTLRLRDRGLLDVYHSPAAESYPAQWRAADGTWHGFAARARVLLVNTDLAPNGERPASVQDLANIRWRGRTAIAKPLFGTTATHAACLFAKLGDEAARQFFRRLKANEIQILAGNKQVAQAVSAGQAAFGLTDTDDALVEIERGKPVAIIYPDQGPDQMGTLFIPNTLAVVKGCPHPAEARRLVDYLLRPEIEKRLAEGPSGQIPLNPAVDAELRIETPQSVKAMEVDWNAAAKAWDKAATFIRDEFTGAD
jgi:iron(III) transport system substrate-binding protein